MENDIVNFSIELAEKYFPGKKVESLTKKTRNQEYVLSRQIYILLMLEAGERKIKIARYLNLDHSTIDHHCRKIKMLLDTDTRLKSLLSGFYDASGEVTIFSTAPNKCVVEHAFPTLENGRYFVTFRKIKN